MGITAADAEFLRGELLRAAVSGEALPGVLDEFGQRYLIDFHVTTAVGTARMRSAWIIDTGSEVPRLVSSYIPDEAK